MSQQATSLESRHEVNHRFHDERLAGRQIDDRDFYAVSGISRRHRNLSGKTVLDFVTK
jgi:hypothetical protein